MTISRVWLVGAALVLGWATSARAEDGTTAPRVAVVRADAARAIAGQRPAAPVLLSVEIVADPPPARADAAAGSTAPRCADAARCAAPPPPAVIAAPAR